MVLWAQAPLNTKHFSQFKHILNTCTCFKTPSWQRRYKVNSGASQAPRSQAMGGVHLRYIYTASISQANKWCVRNPKTKVRPAGYHSWEGKQLAYLSHYVVIVFVCMLLLPDNLQPHNPPTHARTPNLHLVVVYYCSLKVQRLFFDDVCIVLDKNAQRCRIMRAFFFSLIRWGKLIS